MNAVPSTTGAAGAEVEEPESAGAEEAAEAPEVSDPEEKVVIGMMTIVSHPSLDAIQQGLMAIEANGDRTTLDGFALATDSAVNNRGLKGFLT